MQAACDVGGVIWAGSREKVPDGLCRCHTKRRMGARPLTFEIFFWGGGEYFFEHN